MSLKVPHMTAKIGNWSEVLASCITAQPKPQFSKFFHAVHQPSGVNHCARNQCAHICLLNPSAYTCACSHGYSLAEDAHKCAESDERYHLNSSDILGQFCNPVCLNGGRCISGNESYFCKCADGFKGPSCADAVVVSMLHQQSNSSSTALASILISVLCVALLVLGYVLYRRNRDKLAALDFSVSFKKPTFRKRQGLLEDEHPIAADEDYHAMNTAPGFINPAFDTRKTQLLSEDGEFKRWASNDSLQSSSSKEQSSCVLAGDTAAKQDQVFFFRKH
ncbi:hypothetical protein MTO96_016560 [Rhipicephalus appendiculatus]